MNPQSVDARLPLALLQAVQRQDTPPDWLPDEDPRLAFPNRLGLTGVIEGQVRLFRELARKRRRVEEEQVESLLALIARRRDAHAIFSAAGQDLAGLHFSGLRGKFIRLTNLLPGPFRQRAALRALRAVNGTFLVAKELIIERTPLRIRARGALTARVPGAACQLYAALSAELVELSGAGPAVVHHTECQSRGDERCVWTMEPDGNGDLA